VLNTIRQGHDDRFTEDFTRICIHWDLLLICNYKCSYCYARNPNFYKDGWLKLPRWEQQESIIESISKCSHPMNIGLLGGEPTLYPHFHKLVDKLHRECGHNKKHDVPNFIYVVTNGSQPREWFENLKNYENMSYLWSFHPEFAEVEPFITNIKVMRDKGYGAKVNLILHASKSHRKKLEQAYLRCKEEGFKVHPHFLYQEDANNLWRYNDDFWKWAKEWFGEEHRDLEFQEYKDGEVVKHLFNDYEVYFNKINSFKGFNCMNSNYEINANGRVIMFCTDKVSSNLNEDPDFFARVGINTMKCPHNFCNCDGLLKIKKYKDGYA